MERISRLSELIVLLIIYISLSDPLDIKKVAMEKLSLMPTVDEAKKGFDLYLNVSYEVYKRRHLCPLMGFIPKARKWCIHLGCLSGNCTMPEYLIPYFSEVTASPIDQSINPVTTNATGTNSCYDDYLCDASWLAFVSNIVLGYIGLILIIVGVVMNTLAIATFNVAGIRSGTTLYMSGIAAVDIIYLLFAGFITVVRNIPNNFDSQVELYGSFSVYFVPWGVPLMQLSEILMMWFIFALLVDRHLYLKYGYHSKSICTREMSAKVMIGITVFLSLYTVPKFFEYKLERNKNTNLMQALRSDIGVNTMYRNTMMHWLKDPIEIFFPVLGSLVLTFIITSTMIDTHTIRQKKMKSITTECMTPRELIEIRENSTATITICFGIFMLAAKIPKSVLHIAISEGYIELKQVIILTLASGFLDIIYAFCKPLFCVYIGYHFRDAIGAMFCCQEPSDLTKQIIKLDMLGKGGSLCELELHSSLDLTERNNQIPDVCVIEASESVDEEGRNLVMTEVSSGC